jgi:phage shock protein C
MIRGVCGGIAEYFDFSAGWIRVIAVFFLITTAAWPVIIIYFIASFIMKPSPECPINNDEEREFYDSYATSPGHAAERLKHRFDQLDRRIRRMEDSVTNRAYHWEQRMNRQD